MKRFLETWGLMFLASVVVLLAMVLFVWLSSAAWEAVTLWLNVESWSPAMKLGGSILFVSSLGSLIVALWGCRQKPANQAMKIEATPPPADPPRCTGSPAKE